MQVCCMVFKKMDGVCYVKKKNLDQENKTDKCLVFKGEKYGKHKQGF